MSEEIPKAEEVLFASKKLRVRHEKWAAEKAKKDGHPFDLMEVIDVRVLPFREFNDLLVASDDDAKLAALYCDRDIRWTDTLTEQSLIDILVLGESLNRPRIAAFVLRRTERVSGLLSGGR